MNTRARLLVALGTLASCVVAIAVWGPHRDVRAPDPARRSQTMRTSIDESAQSSVAHGAEHAAVPRQELAIRERFRRSKDYAEFVKSISAAAGAGERDAEYFTAEALKYCDENLNRFFRTPGGTTRSLNDAQQKWASRPAGYQQEIVVTYDRCHAFLEEPELQDATSAWKSWLKRSADAEYPPAEAEQADLMRITALVSGGGTGATSDGGPTAYEQAKSLALMAVQSGDPDTFIKMANWVDGKSHAPEEYENLVSAWQLLACQRGLDCGPTSEWLRSMCNWDPQCAEGQTVSDYLQRRLGSRFDDVQRLATDIARAVDAKDVAGIQSHL